MSLLTVELAATGLSMSDGIAQGLRIAPQIEARQNENTFSLFDVEQPIGKSAQNGPRIGPYTA